MTLGYPRATDQSGQAGDWRGDHQTQAVPIGYRDGRTDPVEFVFAILRGLAGLSEA